MYERPYYYQDNPDYPPFFGNPPLQQTTNQYNPYSPYDPIENVQYQTPFAHFAKPKQPENWYQSMHPIHALSQPPYGQQSNPGIQGNPGNAGNAGNAGKPGHPGNPASQGHPGNPPNSLLSSFKDANGQMNLDKMLSTVGQIANTYHQVAPIVKQFGSFMKTFR